MHKLLLVFLILNMLAAGIVPKYNIEVKAEENDEEISSEIIDDNSIQQYDDNNESECEQDCLVYFNVADSLLSISSTKIDDSFDNEVVFNNESWPWAGIEEEIDKIQFLGDVKAPADMSSAFETLTNLKEIDFSNLDTSKVTNINNLFKGNSNLTSVDLSMLDLSNVTSTDYMFANTSIGSIKLPNNLTVISSYAFYYSKNLTEVVIPDSVTTIGS